MISIFSFNLERIAQSNDDFYGKKKTYILILYAMNAMLTEISQASKTATEILEMQPY